MVRRMLTVADRVEIAQGLKAGWSIRAIAGQIDRSPSVVSREVRRNWLKTRGYRLVHADCAAQARRRRPQTGKVAADEVLRARVLADLGQSRTPTPDRRPVAPGGPGRDCGPDERIPARGRSHRV